MQCAQYEKQILELEDENTRLRGGDVLPPSTRRTADAAGGQRQARAWCGDGVGLGAALSVGADPGMDSAQRQDLLLANLELRSQVDFYANENRNKVPAANTPHTQSHTHSPPR